MVNQKRVKRKLPELLVDGPLTKKVNFNQYHLNRYKLNQLQKRNASLLNRHVRRVFKALQDLEDVLNGCEIKIE